MSTYSREDFRTNFLIGVGDILLGLLVTSTVTAFLYFSYIYFENIRVSFLGYASFGWSVQVWLLAILLDDLTYYWFHRTSHRIRILWACHIVHHSSLHFNFSTAVRNSWAAVFYKPFFWAWLAVIGLHPLMILTCMSLSACYQFFCHTKIFPLWDKLSRWMTTPGLHAIHHGKEDHCIDKNFAGVFVFIDRIFGTYQPIDQAMKVTFGVTNPPKRQDCLEVNIHEFRILGKCLRRSKSFKERIKYIVKGPEWKPVIDK